MLVVSDAVVREDHCLQQSEKVLGHLAGHAMPLCLMPDAPAAVQSAATAKANVIGAAVHVIVTGTVVHADYCVEQREGGARRVGCHSQCQGAGDKRGNGCPSKAAGTAAIPAT